MSQHYFSELFKQSTGHTPHTYVLHQRIERAKQRLRDPECSIIDAGLDAGFENPSHFARVFRRVVGTTPSGFRAEQGIPKRLSMKADSARDAVAYTTAGSQWFFKKVSFRGFRRSYHVVLKLDDSYKIRNLKLCIVDTVL